MSELKGKVFLLGAEGCGHGDDDLGFEILSTLLETLPEREDRPAAIILWNTAARLAAEGSPLLSRLRELEERGVEVLTGRSCLVALEIEDKVTVGKVATMGETLDLILRNDVISL